MASMTPMWFVAPLVVLVLVGMTVVVLAIVIVKLWQFRALERGAAIRQPVERPGALRSGLRPLEVIAFAAPLLGASGTVLGLFDAFRRLDGTVSGVNPATIAGGLWEASLTTAAGLAVGIPALTALNRLESRADRLAQSSSPFWTRGVPNTDTHTMSIATQ